MIREVIALSGGGAKGRYQANVLKHLEKQAGVPLCDYYDMGSATSVGSINLAILASGLISMKKLDEKYDEISKQIFKKGYWFRTPKYKRKYISDSFMEIINKKDFKFGDVKFDIMITSVDEITNINHFFKSWKDKHKNIPIVKLILRSSAAPFFFGSMIDCIERKIWSDGGSGTSNFPLDELKNECEVRGWYQGNDNLILNAIGCLYTKHQKSFEKESNKSGWRATASQMLRYMNPLSGGRARTQSREDQVRRMSWLAKNHKNLFFRYYDLEVEKKYDKMDDLSCLDFYKKAGKISYDNPKIFE